MELTVQNTGQAPQADQMDELFTPFHSLKPEGTGFGLPIANTIAHRNMGALTLESGGDLGIQCRISLPAVTPIS
jgi:signal transduction histidine kinase